MEKYKSGDKDGGTSKKEMPTTTLGTPPTVEVQHFVIAVKRWHEDVNP